MHVENCNEDNEAETEENEKTEEENIEQDLDCEIKSNISVGTGFSETNVFFDF